MLLESIVEGFVKVEEGLQLGVGGDDDLSNAFEADQDGVKLKLAV